MKIAVVGGGFTGLACALSLAEKGVEVVLFEESKALGGLAGGVKEEDQRWSLEYFYHHVFTNDREILALAKKVGVEVLIKNPETTCLINKRERQLDSVSSVLKFSEIGIFGRLRMGAGLALLKLIPTGLFLEKFKVEATLPFLIGKEGYKTVWERLLKAKFGPFSSSINMAWFWARVAKRTKKLGYFEEGFQNLANKTAEKIGALGGEIRMENKVKRVVSRKEGGWLVDDCAFDGVVMTLPATLTETILEEQTIKFPKIEYLWGQTMILGLREKLISGYWMNILEKNWPFLVVVEHTNLIDKKYYGNNHMVYLGNYLPDGNKQLEMNKEELLHLYLPFLRKINKSFRKKWIKKVSVFRKPFAQPVFPTNYSSQLPPIAGKQKGLYIANMSMVYPFDRGVNYAVKMGSTVAKKILDELR